MKLEIVLNKAYILIILISALAAEAQTDKNKGVREEKINVGSYSLYIKCVGSGSPTVILEAGASSPSSDWDKVMPEIGKFTRVCAYDRANIGKSEAAQKPRTGGQVVDDLHALLEKSGESAPYVLVGHSFGGIYSILYANQYPRDIVGMVLVDSSHEDQFIRFEALMTPEQLEQSRARRAVAPEGINTTKVRDELRAIKWRTDVPLFVLVHGKTTLDMIPPGWSAEQLAKREQAWREMQADYSKRSTRGKLIIAENSGHYIQNDQPELVIDAVKQVVKLTRKKLGKSQNR